MLTPYTLGAAGQATGPHCILNTGASSAVYGPTGVTLNLALTLQPSAVGTQNIYVEAFDYDYGNYNSTYYTGLAGWQAYALLTTAPPTVSMAPPPSPTSANSQVLQYELSDGNGYTFIDYVYGQLAANSSNEYLNSPCYFQFDPPNLIFLWQTVNGNNTFLGQGYLGGSYSYPSTNGIIGGGPNTCSINLNQSTAYTNTSTYAMDDPNSGTPWPHTNLYLNLSTSLDTTVLPALPLNIYLQATDLMYNSSASVDVGTWSAAPVLTSVAISPSTVIGGSSPTITVTLSAPAPSNATVYLTSTAPSAFNPGSVSVAAGATTGSASFTAGTVTASTPVTVTGTYNNGTGQSASFTVAPPPNFTIGLTAPNPATVIAGAPANYTVTVTSVAGFAGNVSLAAAGLPAGAIASFSPAIIAGGSGTSTMAVSSPVGLTAAVAGTLVGGTLSHTAVSGTPLTVQDFVLTVSPSSSPASPLITAAGQTVTFTVSAAGLNNYSAPVNLSLSIPQLQTCPTCIGETLAEGGVTPGGGPATFTWLVPSNTVGGTYSYTIGGSSPGLAHSVMGQVSVAPQDFTASLVQSPIQTISSPGSGSFTMSLTSINNFAGNVAFGGLPYNWTTAINGVTENIPQATLTAGGTVTFPFNINFPSGLPSGPTSFAILAQSGSVSHAANTWITIGPNPGSVLSVSSTHSGSFSIGQPGSYYTVAVTNQAGAGATSGTVTVTETLPAGLSLASNMSGAGWSCGVYNAYTCTRSDALTGGASYPSINVPVNVGLNAPTQVYNQVTVTGSNSQSAGTTDLTAIQGSTSPPDFTLTASQNPQTVAPGGSTTYSISVNSLGSFGNTAVSLSMGAIAGVTASVTPSAQHNAPATLTLTASPTASFGTIPILVTGISGATTHYTVANLRVAPVAPAAIVTPPPGQFIPGGTTTFTWNSGNGASQFTLAAGSTPGAADLYSGSMGSSQTASVSLPNTIGQTVYVTLNSSTPAGVALTPQSYAYTISTQGVASGLQLVSGPAANVNINGGEVAYTYKFSGGDARAMTACVPTVEVVTLRLIQQTATSATIGFTAIPGTQPQAFDFSCGCPGSGGGQTSDPPVIFGVTPSQIQPNTSASINIAGVNFGDPALGASDTVEICPLSSSGTISGGCSSLDVTPASDTLIAVDVSLQAAAYGYAVTVISDEDDEESNQATLGVSTSAPIVYDTPPQITSVVPGDIPALSGQAVAIVGTNLGNAGSLSICQGSACLPWVASGPWGNTEVSLIVDASSATPGTSYTVSLSTTVDSLGNAYLAAPGSAPDSTSASLEIDPAPPTITSISPGTVKIGTQNAQLTITGAGFGQSPTVNLGEGITIVSQSGGNQSIALIVNVSYGATVGQNPVNVTAAGAESNYVDVIIDGPGYMVVESDLIGTCSGCTTTVARLVTYQITNFSGSNPGTIPICEMPTIALEPTPPGAWTCDQPLPTIDYTRCSDPGASNPDGTFTDKWTLVTDGYTPAGCGAADSDPWMWAPSGTATVPFGLLWGGVFTNSVSLNSFSSAPANMNPMPTGTKIYPNGTTILPNGTKIPM